jgi:hypothetical protein
MNGEFMIRPAIGSVAISSLLFFAMILPGCSTGYGPAGEFGGFDHGGYTDTRENANTAVVTFRGNSNTPASQVHNYLLYRCAQVTLEDGYDYFIVTSTTFSPVNVNVATRDSYNNYQTDPPKLYTTFYHSSTYKSSRYTHTSVPGFYPDLHGAVAVIKMFQGKAPSGAYNAHDIIAQLAPAAF